MNLRMSSSGILREAVQHDGTSKEELQYGGELGERVAISKE